MPTCFGWRAGDMREVSIAGDARCAPLSQGVWRDYEHQSGAIIMDHEPYVALTGDRAMNTVWLWLDDGVSRTDVQRRFATPAGGRRLRSAHAGRAATVVAGRHSIARSP